jgi:hypothetical protein
MTHWDPSSRNFVGDARPILQRRDLWSSSTTQYPVPTPVERAVKMTVAMREATGASGCLGVFLPVVGEGAHWQSRITRPHACLVSAYALKGEADRAAKEIAEARSR